MTRLGAKLEGHVVTFKHVVFAIPVVATALAAAGGWVLVGARERGELGLQVAYEAKAEVAKVSDKVDAQNKAIADEMKQTREAIYASETRTSTKLDELKNMLIRGEVRAATRGR